MTMDKVIAELLPRTVESEEEPWQEAVRVKENRIEVDYNLRGFATETLYRPHLNRTVERIPWQNSWNVHMALMLYAESQGVEGEVCFEDTSNGLEIHLPGAMMELDSTKRYFKFVYTPERRELVEDFIQLMTGGIEIQ